MNLIRAKYAPEAQVNQFIDQNKDINHMALLTDGYVIAVNDHLIGCFILEPLTKKVYWLKQLHIVNTEALKLPVLVEAILGVAKELQAQKVFVNSHQTMLDMLLETLQFYPQAHCELLDKYPVNVGKWWSYQVS